MGKKIAKYATAEERRAGASQAMRANWRNPVMRSAWERAMSAAAKTRNDERLSAETLSQFSREYLERDPTEQRMWRYTVEELARRYLISPTYVPTLAMKQGLHRRQKMHKLGPAKVKAIRHRFVVLGHTVRALSLAMKVSDPAIRYWLKTAGITPAMRGTGAPPERIAA